MGIELNLVVGSDFCFSRQGRCPRRRERSTPGHICSLRSLSTLDNFEFNRVPFIQGFVSLGYDCCVMYKYIWAVIAPDEAVTSCVIEPPDCAMHFCVSGM